MRNWRSELYLCQLHITEEILEKAEHRQHEKCILGLALSEVLNAETLKIGFRTVAVKHEDGYFWPAKLKHSHYLLMTTDGLFYQVNTPHHVRTMADNWEARVGDDVFVEHEGVLIQPCTFEVAIPGRFLKEEVKISASKN